MAIFFPLQGFWNALIYVRPRIVGWKRRRDRHQQQQQQQQQSSQRRSTNTVQNKTKGTNSQLQANTAATRNPHNQEEQLEEGHAQMIQKGGGPNLPRGGEDSLTAPAASDSTSKLTAEDSPSEVEVGHNVEASNGPPGTKTTKEDNIDCGNDTDSILEQVMDFEKSETK